MTRRPSPGTLAEMRALVVVLSGAGLDGMTVHDLARRTGLSPKRIYRLIAGLRRSGDVVPHPAGRRVKVGGRWHQLLVRSDLLLDKIRNDVIGSV